MATIPGNCIQESVQEYLDVNKDEFSSQALGFSGKLHNLHLQETKSSPARDRARGAITRKRRICQACSKENGERICPLSKKNGSRSWRGKGGISPCKRRLQREIFEARECHRRGA